MVKLKSLLTKVIVLGIVVTMQFGVVATAIAATENSGQIEKTVKENNDGDRWLALGVHTQYPSDGGIWKYGFWDLYVRSYYTVNRCHGSTVIVNGNKVRSIDTRAGRKSIAEKWALNGAGMNDQYYYRICN